MVIRAEDEQEVSFILKEASALLASALLASILLASITFRAAETSLSGRCRKPDLAISSCRLLQLLIVVAAFQETLFN